MASIVVSRQPNESTSGLLRRFSKKVQASGLIRKAKALRFQERAQSSFKRKRATLARLERRQATERLKKLGKI